MKVTLQYFDGCPNWQKTRSDLDEALTGLGLEASVETMLIETQGSAEQHGFRGSPTVLIDGNDPFAEADAPVGLSCRIYMTESGMAGTPSMSQLREALAP